MIFIMIKFLIKIGGEVIKNNLENIINTISNIKDKVLIVHGGREIVNFYSEKFGIKPKFVISPEGIRSRYTDAEELDIYIMAMSLINNRITSMLNFNGTKSIGINGIFGNLIVAKKKEKIVIINERNRKQIIEGGYTGKITRINKEVLDILIDYYDCIVISPIAIDIESKCILNVDSDQVTSELAKAMKPEKLIFLTDVNGLKLESQTINVIKSKDISNIIDKVGIGMNRKLLMIQDALMHGVNEAIIASGLVKDFMSEIENSTRVIQ